MPTDLVFTGGSVFAEAASKPKDVAVSAGRIVAIGDPGTVEGGPGARIVDLRGRMLVPGFVDAHVHPVQAGLVMRSCDLSAVTTEPEYLDAIARYAAHHPAAEWVTGAGWTLATFPGGLPSREALDSVVPDRPAYLPNRDHHGAWVNSRALERAGITASTPDPPDGRIERAPDGSPSGVLHEGAMHLVDGLLPQPTIDDHVEALLLAQRYLHGLGVTGWQDALLGSYSNMTDPSQAYQRCAEDGRLTAKVTGALWWDRYRGPEQIADLEQRRSRYRAPRFRATAVKIMQDGIVENFTAAMTSPYLDESGESTSNSGHSMIDPEALRDDVIALDRRGFQVHVHAIGDRAIREALDAFEAALAANGRSDNRHHVAHIQVIHPDDVARFGSLGVAANMQALWATHEPQMDELTIPFIGPQRTGWQYPFASLRDTGARLVAGSDWPVSSPNPLEAIHVAVNRRAPAGPPGIAPLLPRQALTVEEGLAAYTQGSAWVNHRDDCGRIEVGAAADLVVLDRDVVTGAAEEIARASVDATYVDGVEVFATDRHGG